MDNDTLLINKQQKKKQRHHHHQLPTRFTRSRLEQELYVSSGTEQLNNSKGVPQEGDNSQLLQEQRNVVQYFEESRDSREEEESTMTPSMGDTNVRLNEVSSSRGINSAVTPSPNKEDDEQQLSPEELAARAQRKANYPLKDIPEPGPNDCLFGRGGGTNHHPGNKLYRKAVENKKQKYLSSKRLDKPLIAMEIINDWRNMDPPGRFLKQNDVTKLWDDVGDKKAREKTSQALREKTPVKQREGGGGLSNNNNTGGGHGNYHHTHTTDREQRTRFEPGTTSPRGRNIKQLSLARDHSLGTEIIGANEISLEGFSWENDDDGNVHAGVGGPPPLPPPPNLDHQQHQQHGHHHHNYPPPQYYQHGGNEQYYQQQHYGGEHQHPPPPHPEQHGHHPPPYPYVREHSLSNNPPSHPHDSNVTHPAPPSFGNNHPSSSTHPPPPPSYYGHHHYPPSSRHGHPPPPPHPGHPRRQFYSPSQQQQHNEHHYLQHGSGGGGPTKPPQHHERSRQHSLQMNPLNGATTAQAARGDAFNEEDESSSAPSVYDRPPPLPPPSPYYGYPPTPPQQGGGGWPTPPGGHASQFTHLPGSNPSAFGQYNTDDRKDSLFSLGSSIDNYYDKQRNSNASSTTAAASRTSGSTITTKGGAINNSDDESGERENPASAGTSQDYSKIADLIRDSSDKTHSSADSRRSISLDNIVDATKGGEGDGITKSKSLPCEENGRVASPGADGSKKQPWVDDKEHNNSNLMRKLSGGALSRGNNTPTPPAGIMRPQTLRPEVVKRDTSNQPETLETKRSVKRVVLSRDQSAVARRLKEEQLALYNNNNNAAAADGSDGGVRVVSSKLTKAEMLDRKMSVEMEKLGIAEIDAAMGAAGAELNVGGGHNNLNRMTTEDIMNAVGGAPALDRMTTDAFLTSLIDTPEEEGETAATGPPPQLGERVTTIDAIALDITTGKPSSGSWDDDTLDLVNQNEHVNAEIAEKWLKGES